MHQEDNQRPVVHESQVIFGENLPGKETWAGESLMSLTQPNCLVECNVLLAGKSLALSMQSARTWAQQIRIIGIIRH